MVRLRVLFLATVLALWAGPEPVFAHHSLAAFDHTKQIVIEGVVKDFEFTNPHSKLTLVERLSDGGSAEWHLETSSPGALYRYNITAHTFAPGEHMTVIAHPQRTDPKGGAIMRIVKADGTTFNLEGAN
jgi:hypothetical protein